MSFDEWYSTFWKWGSSTDEAKARRAWDKAREDQSAFVLRLIQLLKELRPDVPDLNAKSQWWKDTDALLERAEAPDWLIWSREHGAWWMPASCGYTRELDKAGRYSLEQATQICEHANRYSERVQETMFPAPK